MKSSYHNAIKYCSFLYLIFWALGNFCFPANAAVFSVNDESDQLFCKFTLQGEIVEGDFERWNEIGVHDSICLDSLGGLVAEALKIARSGHWTRTVVRNGSTCASACALIFLSGRELGVSSFSISRELQPGGKLGFHSPYAIFSNDQSYGPEDMSLAALQGQDLARYLSLLTLEYEQGGNRPIFSPELFYQMYYTDINSVFYISTVGDSIIYDIKISNVSANKELDSNSIINICTNLITNEWGKYIVKGENRRDGFSDFSKRTRSYIEKETKIELFSNINSKYDFVKEKHDVGVISYVNNPAYGSVGTSQEYCVVKYGKDMIGNRYVAAGFVSSNIEISQIVDNVDSYELEHLDLIYTKEYDANILKSRDGN